MNGGKWLADRILNGPFRGHETKEMELQRVPPESVLEAGDSALKGPSKQQESLSLKQFLEKFSLPRIVKIVPEEPIAAAECSDPAALLNCTLLLYKQYRSGKIEAKKFLDARNTKLVESSAKDVASTIVIPDTYQGESPFLLFFCAALPFIRVYGVASHHGHPKIPLPIIGPPKFLRHPAILYFLFDRIFCNYSTWLLIPIDFSIFPRNSPSLYSFFQP